MSLSAGQRLGSYEILALLGAGGMGEVYRARDTKLQRDVAIKIVPAALAGDPVARARFDAESRAVAALSHPNVIAIFDAGSEGGVVYAVTELLEGKTLRDVLKDGPLPVRRAIDVAVQVASGLSAAHAQGITHRDLKPENIFVMRDGRVKVLDFGLAKVVEPVPESKSVAATYTPTSPGVVLGTVGYMSPEQVRARPVDHRSDIFSLGAVLYEMLTGTRAFAGASAVETMNAIITAEPPELARSNAALPPALDRIVRRCLEKEPEQRFESARDLGFALEAISTSSASVALSAAAATAAPRRQRAVMAALVLAAAAAGVVAGRFTAPVVVPQTVTFESKTFDPMTVFNGRFGPDGETVVFSAASAGRTPDLYVFRPDGVAPQRFGPPKTHLLSISSSGELAVLTNAEYIGHRLFRGTLARMRLEGTPRPWLENVREADWSPDGSTLAIVREVGLRDQLEYPIGKTLYTVSGYISDVRVSPDGERVAFFEHPIRFDDRGWLKVADKTGSVKTLTPEYWGAEGIAWTSDGKRIVYAAGEKGWDSFYPRVVTTDGTIRSSFGVSGIGMFLFDVSPKSTWLLTRNDDERGARAFLPGDTEERELTWLGSVGGLGGGLSPSGRLYLFTDESESAGPTYAVSIRNTDRSPPVRLGPGGAVALSPDETRVLADRITPPGTIIYSVGAGEAVELSNGALTSVNSRGWFSDGRRIVVCGREASKPFRCYQQDVASAALTPLTPENYDVGPLSPDDRTIVLLAPNDTPGLFDLESKSARPLAGAGAADNIVAWSSDGRSLFVQKRDDTVGRLERLEVATGRRTQVRELKPPDRTTLMRVRIGSVIGDGAGYSYTYWKRPSRLLVARGVPQ